MRIPDWLRRFLLRRMDRMSDRRPPNFIIGRPGDPYLFRWYVIPKNPIFNIYFHIFARSDDDRALHDHPWWNLSILLHGSYREIVPIDPDVPNGATKALCREEGEIAGRRANASHRVWLYNGCDGEPAPVWTLFITGPKVREWGFWCLQGWKHWREFTKPGPNGEDEYGEGCGEYDDANRT